MSSSEPPSRTALILYGSETGNAQDVAEELGQVAERLHFSTHVAEMNTVKADSLISNSLTIFVVSTTGQGDLPVNALSFWKTLLLARLPPTFLKGVNFAVFGLGDSSYPKFNWAARKLHKRLYQLGANEIYPRGEADQQHPEGLEGTFIPWLTGFREHLIDKYPLPVGQTPIPDEVQLPPKWVLQQRENLAQGRSSKDGGVARGTYLWEEDDRPIPDSLNATLVENRRLTPSTHWQDVRHIILSVSDPPLDYSPGDIISILPKNFPSDVDLFINLMNWSDQADEPITFVPGVGLRNKANIPPPPIPYLTSSTNLTLRILLTEYLDIRSIPRRSFFANISHYTTNDMHKERLVEFTNPEFIDEFWDYTTRSRRSILEVLQEFDSVQIPWQHAATVLPILRGRQFSLASGGSLKHPMTTAAAPELASTTNFELLVAIVRYKTIIKKLREGVCTRYLSALKPGSSTLRIQLHRNNASKSGLNPTPRQLLGPSILIGPGTGLAPLRSIIYERAALIKHLKASRTPNTPLRLSPIILIYGGRNVNADYFFSEEWDKFLADEAAGVDGTGIGLQVFTAFSRDQRQKVYVQDRIRENKELIVNVLRDQGGSVFVCGSSGRMPLAVREALVECLQGVFESESHDLVDDGGEKEKNGAFVGEEGKGMTVASASIPTPTPTLSNGTVADNDSHARYLRFREKAENYLLEMEKTGRYKQETW